MKQCLGKSYSYTHCDILDYQTLIKQYINIAVQTQNIQGKLVI